MAREYPLIQIGTLAGVARIVAEAVNKLLGGRGNNVGTFNLDANPATTTTVLNNRVESGMTISLMAETAAAATCQPRVTTIATGSFVVTHLPVLSTATFRYEFRG